MISWRYWPKSNSKWHHQVQIEHKKWWTPGQYKTVWRKTKIQQNPTTSWTRITKCHSSFPLGFLTSSKTKKDFKKHDHIVDYLSKHGVYISLIVERGMWVKQNQKYGHIFYTYFTDCCRWEMEGPWFSWESRFECKIRESLQIQLQHTFSHSEHGLNQDDGQYLTKNMETNVLFPST